MAEIYTYMDDAYNWHKPSRLRKVQMVARLEVDDEPIKVIEKMAKMIDGLPFKCLSQLWYSLLKPFPNITVEFEVDILS